MYKFQVPDADHERLEDAADKIKREATRIREEAERWHLNYFLIKYVLIIREFAIYSRLLSENNELLLDAADRRAALEDTLRRAEQQQVRVKKNFLKTLWKYLIFRLYFYTSFFRNVSQFASIQNRCLVCSFCRMYFQHQLLRA